jgi:magnesium chelatase family protein
LQVKNRIFIICCWFVSIVFLINDNEQRRGDAMLSKTRSATVQGVNAFMVDVEVDVRGGGPETNVTIVGLPDTAIRESRQRVWSALASSGHEPPFGMTVISLSPGDLKKEGAAFDLPIALAIVACQGGVAAAGLANLMVLGELGLDGSVRPLRGVLTMALLARSAGVPAMIVPRDNAREAALAVGVAVYGVASLGEAVDLLRSGLQVPAESVDVKSLLSMPFEELPDLADVKGQTVARRALEVAAAGGHNLLFVGPPGTGKTMLAQRLPSILPPLTFEEALEATRIHSIAGTLPAGSPLVMYRPFRAPHHTISDAGLLGGHTNPRPGEVSLAHGGVLFLDELPEFSRHVLETLRQPLENGTITISRACGSATFPADFMLVAAMNPCPCGFHGSSRKTCRCSWGQIQKYRSRLSGPLLDRIDLHVEVATLNENEMVRQDRRGPSSAEIRAKVATARQFQEERYAGQGIRCNAALHGRRLDQHCKLTDTSRQQLLQAAQTYGLSARACDRILRVARTIADLEASPAITSDHLFEAIQYRILDKKYW